MYKTDAAAGMLKEINPDVEIEAIHSDVLKLGQYEDFVAKLLNGGKSMQVDDGTNEKKSKRVDLVLGCVDNFGARLAINSACCEYGFEWMESGVSEDAVSGHIQFIVPGLTACFECSPPLIVASGIPESTLKREGVCAASLPTTTALTAATLVQNALKRCFRYGKVSLFLGYSSLSDYFPSYAISPNVECTNDHCRSKQETMKTKRAEILAAYSASNSTSIASSSSLSYSSAIEDYFDYRIKLDTSSSEVVHAENEFGIELVSDDLIPPQNDHVSESARPTSPSTIDLATNKEDPTEITTSADDAQFSSNASSGTDIRSSLAELRAKLRDSQKK